MKRITLFFLCVLLAVASFCRAEEVRRAEPVQSSDVVVTKIHEVRNDESYHPHHNTALEFEKDYWNYGAITKDQKEAMRGQIYLISWRNKGPAAPFTTKFEYRQAKSREKLKVQTQEFASVHGNARSLIKVVGDEYRDDGPVEGWRFTVWRDGQLVAEERSFIW